MNKEERKQRKKDLVNEILLMTKRIVLGDAGDSTGKSVNLHLPDDVKVEYKILFKSTLQRIEISPFGSVHLWGVRTNESNSRLQSFDFLSDMDNLKDMQKIYNALSKLYSEREKYNMVSSIFMSKKGK